MGATAGGASSRIARNPAFVVALVVAAALTCGHLAPSLLVDSLLSLSVGFAAAGLLSIVVVLIVPGWRSHAKALAKTTGLLVVFWWVTLVGYSPRLTPGSGPWAPPAQTTGAGHTAPDVAAPTGHSSPPGSD